MLVAAAAVVLLAPSPATAATFKVDCKKQSLQNRINAVPAGSVLLVKGTCGPVTINKKITIDGNPTATISGKGVDRAVNISGAPSVKLIDLRITGGKIVAQLANGGGIYHFGGLLELRRTVVTGNLVESTPVVGALAQGGGIYSAGGTLRLFDSVVWKNTARGIAGTGASAYGAGIIQSGNLVLDHTTVSRNLARAEVTTASGALATGGGINTSSGSLTVKSSHIDRNVATAIGSGGATYAVGEGAGLSYAGSSSVTITGSTLSKNQALSSLVGGTATAISAGAELSNAAKMTVKNSVIAGNLARATSPSSATADAYGAGLHITSSNNVSITGSRFTGGRVVATSSGTATGSGGGLSIADSGITVRNSLVAANTIDATAGGGPATAEGGGVLLENSSSLLLTGSTVRENRAESSGAGVRTSTGGGIASLSSVLRVATSTLNANVASSGQALGGALFLNAGGPHTLLNSTLTGNKAIGSRPAAAGSTWTRRSPSPRRRLRGTARSSAAGSTWKAARRPFGPRCSRSTRLRPAPTAARASRRRGAT